jgi:transposase
MIANQTTRIHYTPERWDYQLKLPIEIGVMIPADDSVRLLSMLMERMDYSKLYRAYERLARTETDPKNLFKVLVYGYMNWQYSSRKIERACRRDINFMYLLDGEPPPDHNTIARFRSTYLRSVMEDLFAQLVDLLSAEGELSLLNLFIDGTKLEAFSNRYTFVWGKRVEKERAKLQVKMKQELPPMAESLGVRFWVGEEIETRALAKFLKRLQRKQTEDNVVFVYGTGKRKTPLQRAMEKVTEYLSRQRGYEQDIRILNGRNSYSKTDHDATFMRMKEDHMRNGQLKPGYNVTIGVDSEYIVEAIVTQDRSDGKTLIPFMERIRRFGYQNITGDAGFESEENYTYLEENGQLAFIKPSNYEQSKTRKYKSDIGRRENMGYDEQNDRYTCSMGYPLVNIGVKKTKSAAGYPIETTIYECANCSGCPHKEKCIRPGGKKPLEERSKRLQVSKTFLRQRAEAEARITSEEGILLRLNRSIQVEGAFGVLKEDMSFRRFLLRGKVKVNIEVLLLCFAYNVKKLHNKIQSGRCGDFLHHPVAA